MIRFLSKSVVLFALLAFLPGTAVLSRGQNTDAIAGTPALSEGSGDVLVATGPVQPASAKLRPYTAGGHVIGFRAGGLVIASGTHALRMEYMNARPVPPIEEGMHAEDPRDRGRAPALGKVTYRDLWQGVTVVYEKAASAVLKSTYYVNAGEATSSHPEGSIRLRYNVPVKVDRGGNLALSFPNGEMRETRPVAWQEISGKRVAVESGYRLWGEREVGFRVGAYDPRYPLVIDPTLYWNTFLGSGGYDEGHGIAVDPNGNIYVTGYSDNTWESPVRPFTGALGVDDAFVAKLDPNGILQWNTFLGGSENDYGYGIATDANGNCYVTGYSYATWGSPIRSFTTGNGGADAFVAKLNTNGVLQWNSFLGGPAHDAGNGITVDIGGNAYVTGQSYESWGSPVDPNFQAGAFVAKLDTGGALKWNAFLGAAGDIGQGIARDGNGNLYVAGESFATWGSPINSYANVDAFVAKLDANGGLIWNTFLGGSEWDQPYGLAADADGNSYVTGLSADTWGSPIRPHRAGFTDDTFAAKLDTNGLLLWNTFLGDTSVVFGGIAVDTGGNSWVTGASSETWGSPAAPFAGPVAASVAKLDTNGVLQWNTFLGGPESGGVDGTGIALDAGGRSYVTGASGGTVGGTWGSPIRPPAVAFSSDAYVAKIPANPLSALAITSLSPSSALTGASGLTLEVHGAAFVDGAVVRWDGSDRSTTYISGSEVDAVIASADLMTGKIVQVTVRDPDGEMTNNESFTVNNPVPVLGSLSPAKVTAGSAGFTLTLTGSGFVPNSVVSWNGTSKATTYVSGTELQATILAGDVAAGSEAQLTVSNPTPAGGTSNAVAFPVSSFTMGAATASVTVDAGQTAHYTIELTPQFGSFDSPVTLSCSQLPTRCTWSFTQASVTPGAAMATSTLTLVTKAASGSVVGTVSGSTGLFPPALGLLLVMLTILTWLSIPKPVTGTAFRRWLVSGALIVLVAVLASCGAKSSPEPTPGTPAGTYQISVQGQSGTLTVSTTVTLIVR